MMKKFKIKITKKLIVIVGVIILSVLGMGIAYGEQTYGIIDNFDLYVENYQTGKLTTVNGIYYGDVAQLKNAPHDGEFDFEVGDNYDGDWVGKTIDGQGTYMYGTLGSYEGNFVNNYRSGYGTFTWSDGSSYSGNWVWDYMSGEGTYKHFNDFEIKGTFEQNKCYSGTIETLVGGTGYTFNIENGTITNIVGIEYSNGSHYSGEYKDGKIEGDGTMTYSNGDIYSGNFVQGLRSGDGTYTWNNGAEYSGKWSNDKMNGNGKYNYPENTGGKSVTGNFINNMINGDSTYVDDDGKEFIVTWANGVCKQVKGANND